MGRGKNGVRTEAHKRALNSRFNETSPSLCQTKDGKFLFFSSDRPGGQGGYDIWVSKVGWRGICMAPPPDRQNQHSF